MILHCISHQHLIRTMKRRADVIINRSTSPTECQKEIDNLLDDAQDSAIHKAEGMTPELFDSLLNDVFPYITEKILEKFPMTFELFGNDDHEGEEWKKGKKS